MTVISQVPTFLYKNLQLVRKSEQCTILTQSVVLFLDFLCAISRPSWPSPPAPKHACTDLFVSRSYSNPARCLRHTCKIAPKLHLQCLCMKLHIISKFKIEWRFLRFVQCFLLSYKTFGNYVQGQLPHPRYDRCCQIY